MFAIQQLQFCQPKQISRILDDFVSALLRDFEDDGELKYVRLGLNYVKGLKTQTAQAIIQARNESPFQSIRDLVRRVPQLNQRDLVRLSELGALNGLSENEHDRHRRGALWHAAAAVRPVGELLEWVANDPDGSPLFPMTPEQRIYSDFVRSGLSIGNHPMSFCREDLRVAGILSAAVAKSQRNGEKVRVAGAVITRQRPGTAKGFVFLSLEDETGIVNVIVSPDLFDRQKEACVTAPYVCIKGTVQNTWNVVSVKAADIQALPYGAKEMPSHNFH